LVRALGGQIKVNSSKTGT